MGALVGQENRRMPDFIPGHETNTHTALALDGCSANPHRRPVPHVPRSVTRGRERKKEHNALSITLAHDTRQPGMTDMPVSNAV